MKKREIFLKTLNEKAEKLTEKMGFAGLMIGGIIVFGGGYLFLTGILPALFAGSITFIGIYSLKAPLEISVPASVMLGIFVLFYVDYHYFGKEALVSKIRKIIQKN